MPRYPNNIKELVTLPLPYPILSLEYYSSKERNLSFASSLPYNFMNSQHNLAPINPKEANFLTLATRVLMIGGSFLIPS